jgi:hypothetical protein
MPVSDEDQVRVLPFLHLSPVEEIPSAALYVQLRPQALMARPQATEAGRRYLADLRSNGWVDPTAALADGRVSRLPAAGRIEGAFEDGVLAVRVGATGQPVYRAETRRPEGWSSLAATNGWVLVVLGADPTLDHKGPYAGVGDDLSAEDPATVAATVRALSARRLIVATRCTPPDPSEQEEEPED